MSKAPCLLATLLIWMLFGCDATTSGGSGTVTTNNISGRVVDGNNKPLENTTLFLRKSNYLPSVDDLINFQDTSENSQPYNANTNAAGDFSLENIPPGKYILEANQENKLAVIANVSMDNSGRSVSLSPLTAKPIATLTGFAPLPQGSRRAWVMVYGLERRIPVDSMTGAFSLRVPEGAYTLRTFYLDLQIARSEIKNIVVNAGENKIVNPFQEWATKRLIHINTTPSGADLSENVTDFPLLVRLNASNFDFDKAQPNGADVRFSNPNGKPMFYEIERWDSQLREAEVWVLVDTVYSNNASQSFFMHVGNSNASDQSSGADVFGKSKYSGVWHLNENAPAIGTPNLYENSVNAFHYGNDFVTNNDKLGSIGLGQSFTHEDYISVENVSATIKPDTAFSLSVWIKSDTVDSGFLVVPADTSRAPYYEKGSEVLSMGNDFGLRIMGTGKIRFFIFDETQRPPTPDSVLYKIHSTGSSYLDNAWHHVVCTFSNSTMGLYIDGNLDSSKTLKINKITYDGSPHFFMGRHGNQEPNFDYMGSMDEVRINKRKDSNSWIKLSYRNQQPQSNVVTLDYKEIP